jgi:hypothetical protein
LRPVWLVVKALQSMRDMHEDEREMGVDGEHQPRPQIGEGRPRPITNAPGICGISVVRSVAIPSAKWSCSESLLRFANGSTTRDRRGRCWAEPSTIFTEVTLVDHRREEFVRFESNMRNVDELMEYQLISGGHD